MPEVRQTSFAAGELNRGLWGRSDLEVYRHGLRVCRNFIVGKMGALRTRPGMRFVREVPPGATKVRLVGLQVSDTESYLVLITNVGIEITGPHTSSSSIVASPYGADDIDNLTFAQSGRSLLIFSPKHRVRRLFIKSAQNASLTQYLPFAIPEAPELNIGVQHRASGLPKDETPKAWAYSVVLSDDETGELVNTRWRKIQKVVDEVDGEFQEIGNVNPLTAVSQEKPITILAYDEQPAPPAGFSYEEIQIFRAMGQSDEPLGLSTGAGWVARIRASDSRFNVAGRAAPGLDIGAAPDAFRLPRSPENPLGTIYPRVGVHHEGRLLVANGARTQATDPALPEQIWCSEVGFHRHFDQYQLRVDSSAFSFKLGGPQSEEIRHLVSAGQLLILTENAVYAVGETLSALAIPQVRKQVGFGSSWVRPLLAGSDVLFAKNGGGVWRLRYSWEHRSYLADELSVTFGGPRVASWCFAQEPLPVVWLAARQSPAGAPFYSMTYVPELGSIGWARHSTGLHVRLDENSYEDQVVDLCALRYQGQDRVFALVQRFSGSTNKLLIEEIGGDSSADDLLLDSAIASSGFVSVPANRKLEISFGHLAGRQVSVALRGISDSGYTVLGPFPIQSGKVVVEVPSSFGDTVHWVAGLAFDAEMELLDLPVDKLRPKTVKKVGLEVQGARGFWVGESRDTMTAGIVRHVTDGFGPPRPGEGVIDVLIHSSWNKHGRVVLQQRDPYALTVLGVTREVEGGG